MAINFMGAFQRLEYMGLTDVLLPFLLIFAIVFAVLDRAKIFGAERKNINIVIAVVVALLVVIPHVTGDYPPGADVIEIMNNAIPNVSIVIIAVVMLLILIGVFGVNVNIAGKSLGGLVAMVAVFIILFIFGRSAGWFGMQLPNWLSWLNDPDTQALLIVLLMFGVIIYFVTGDEGKGTTGESFLGMFKELGGALDRVK